MEKEDIAVLRERIFVSKLMTTYIIHCNSLQQAMLLLAYPVLGDLWCSDLPFSNENTNITTADGRTCYVQ